MGNPWLRGSPVRVWDLGVVRLVRPLALLPLALLLALVPVTRRVGLPLRPRLLFPRVLSHA